LGSLSKFLEDQIDHLAERRVLVLEEFGNAKEKGGGFVGRELLAGEEKYADFGEEDPAFSRGYRGGIEESCCVCKRKGSVRCVFKPRDRQIDSWGQWGGEGFCGLPSWKTEVRSSLKPECSASSSFFA